VLSATLLKTLWQSCGFAVPVFVMITGFLLLSPSKEISCRKILDKYVLRVLVVLLSFGSIYTWLEVAFDERAITLSQVPVVICKLVSGDTWDHLWYLYMLTGLYLILPLCKVFIRNSSKTELYFILTVLALFSLIVPFVEKLSSLHIGLTLPLRSEFLFYLLWGYAIGTVHVTKRSFLISIVLLVITILGYFLFFFIQEHYGSFAFSEKFSTAGNSPFTALVSTCVFLIFSYKKDAARNLFARTAKWATISDCTFGIYIIHPLFLNIFTKLLHINPIGYGLLSFSAMILTAFGLSFAATFSLKKVPTGGRYI
jgi:surface polysaccharide O-acyltransferase-like enzyme